MTTPLLPQPGGHDDTDNTIPQTLPPRMGSHTSTITTKRHVSPRSRYILLLSDNKESARQRFRTRATAHFSLDAMLVDSQEEKVKELTDAEWSRRFQVLSKLSTSRQACGELFKQAESIKLRFVNRENEISKFVSCLVRTQVIQITDTNGVHHFSRVTPFLDQMFGSGKTTLATMALKCAHDGLRWEQEGGIPYPENEYGLAICRELFETDDVADMEQSGNHDVSEEEVLLKQQILYHTVQSLVVPMDFRAIMENSSFQENLCACLADLVGYPRNEKNAHFREIVSKILAKENKRSMLIVVDEVHGAAVDEIRELWRFMATHAAILAKSPSNRTLLHFVFCGRQTLFSSLGHGSQSPTRILWIPLPALKHEHLKLITANLSQARQLPNLEFPTNDIEEHFFKRLLETTGGIPRILQYVFGALSKLLPQMILPAEQRRHRQRHPLDIYTPSILLVDELEIDYIFDEVLFKGFAHGQYVPDRDKYAINNGAKVTNSEEERILQVALGALLLHSETGHPITIGQEIRVGDSKHKLGDLLNHLPLFLDTVETDEGQKLKIQKSQYVMRILSTSRSMSDSPMETLLSFLCDINRHGISANITQDAALLFKLLLTCRMVQQIQMSRSTGSAFQVPGLNNVMDSWTIPEGFEFARGVWPKVTTAHQDKKKSTINSDLMKIRPFGDRLECKPNEMANEIRRLIHTPRNNGSGGGGGTYVYMVRGKSGSADFYVIHVDVGNQMAMVLGVQAKSGKKDPITNSKLNEEWNKFWATCPQQINGMTVHYVLIIAARTYSANVNKTMKTPLMNGILHLNGTHRYFVSTLGSQQYLVSVSHKGLESTKLSDIRAKLYHLSSPRIPATDLHGIRNQEPRKGKDHNAIVLPISADEEVHLGGNIRGFYPNDPWTELEEAVNIPCEDNCHLILWNESTISHFLGAEVWKQFNIVKETSEDPQQLVSFVTAYINGGNRGSQRQHVISSDTERPYDTTELISKFQSFLLASKDGASSTRTEVGTGHGNMVHHIGGSSSSSSIQASTLPRLDPEERRDLVSQRVTELFEAREIDENTALMFHDLPIGIQVGMYGTLGSGNLFVALLRKRINEINNDNA